MLSYKPAFSLSSFTFIKRLFSPSSLSAIRVISSAYLLTLIPAILIPGYDSSTLTFCMIILHRSYISRVTINSLDVLLSNLEPVLCSISRSNCCFLTCIQVSQKAGKVVWYSHLFKNFPQFIVIHKVKDFSKVNEAEVDFFLILFFYNPTDV